MLGAPIIRIMVFGGLYSDSLALGNYHIYICIDI